MEDNSGENKPRKHKLRDLFEEINPLWSLIGVCATIGGLGLWIGGLTTKYEYLQIINEKNIEHQKEIQEVRDELVKCQLDVKILESIPEEKDGKRKK